MSGPLVTIGITCFNAADTVLRAVESAFAQDWQNFEVVIVDDCSNDESADLVMTAIANRSQAKLIRHSVNLGPGTARNSILRESRGEFIAFFDDDDLSLPTRISEQMNALADYEQLSGVDLIACFASGIRRYPNGYTLDLPAIGSRGVQTPRGADVASYLLTYRRRPDWFYGTGTPACSLLARRSTFGAVGGFDDKLRRAEDADFAIRLALLDGHFIGIPRPLFVQYSTNTADKSPERNLQAQRRLARKHKSYLQSIGRLEYAERWPKLRYWHFTRRYGRFLCELVALWVRYPLAVTRHIFSTGPQRLWHERRLRF